MGPSRFQKDGGQARDGPSSVYCSYITRNQRPPHLVQVLHDEAILPLDRVEGIGNI